MILAQIIPDGHYLDFSRTGIPWLDRLLDTAAVIVLVVMVVCAVGFIAWTRWIHPAISKLQATAEKAAKDAAVTRGHAENSHADAPHPNLRDNIDANQAENRAAFQTLNQALDQMREALAQQALDIGGIRSELRADRQAQRETARALAEHIRDKQLMEPRLADVERELKTHRKKTETP
ncbi:MAG TPA: hypothetical protein H9821_07375 [Candidatus Rothia avicola]|uniref:Uncharacterized protein n=1 Tax=Candidatus Rothia avicola TaxID=2840478 RepID=A0A9D1ZTA2_9MICC|nr:hypothetical protein [Candidatus Rothia avicola]